jgi:hypothetical protein
MVFRREFIALQVGSRKIASFYYQNDFLPVLGENYIRCCSQEKGEGLFEGRLTRLYKESRISSSCSKVLSLRQR